MAFATEGYHRTMTAIYTPKIREFVKNTIVEPARERGDDAVLIRIGDVHKEMKLTNRTPEICSALQNRAFETDARVKLLYASLFPYQGANRELVFKVLP